ncbi:MAG: sigma-70 family RNA polymerase sigma factor [Phycisphaerae bacterium]|nr:sigma-70 family RNA polymerase sigma factor [Phycisphaerae bacterium]
MTQQTSDILEGTEPASPDSGAESIAFDEGVLVELAQRGDSEAFGGLVVMYQDRLYNVVSRLCNCSADVEEITQEAFLKAFEKISDFRGGSRFYTWLFRIATNLALTRLRRSKCVKFHSLEAADETDTLPGSDVVTQALAEKRNAPPEAAAMARETQQQIEAALQQLDEDHRAVVVLRDVEDMNYSQIAAILELPAGTVKSRLYRARCILRDKLGDLIG